MERSSGCAPTGVEPSQFLNHIVILACMFFKKDKKATPALRADLQTVVDQAKIKREHKTKAVLNDLLKTDETAQFALTCRKGDRFGIMVVTDQRVVWVSQLVGQTETYTVARDKISGLETARGSMGLMKITIGQSGKNAEFDYVGKSQALELAKLLN